jgi:hypothetical protein
MPRSRAKTWVQMPNPWDMLYRKMPRGRPGEGDGHAWIWLMHKQCSFVVAVVQRESTSTLCFTLNLLRYKTYYIIYTLLGLTFLLFMAPFNSVWRNNFILYRYINENTCPIGGGSLHNKQCQNACCTGGGGTKHWLRWTSHLVFYLDSHLRGCLTFTRLCYVELLLSPRLEVVIWERVSALAILFFHASFSINFWVTIFLIQIPHMSLGQRCFCPGSREDYKRLSSPIPKIW